VVISRGRFWPIAPPSNRKGANVDRSVSVFLPVHNAQATLAGNVARVLDVLPELTERFEVLIIDDASTDGTEEVADDLSRKFPQVKVTRNASRQGHAQSVQSAMTQANGEIVFVPEQDLPVATENLARLWQLREDDDVALAQSSGLAGNVKMIRRGGQNASGGLQAEARRLPECNSPSPAVEAPSFGLLSTIAQFVFGE